MSKIKKITAREILDSRGNPTIETKVILENGICAKASVPSGASTGVHEALELRDGDKKRYGGKGVLKACKNVNNQIAKLLKGFEVTKQREIDNAMIKLDGTENKSKLGANAILSVSLACARAASLSLDLPLYKYLRKIYNLNLKSYNLPLATMNILNGGKHADWAADIQEFMIIPQIHKGKRGFSFKESVRAGAEIFHALRKILKEKGYSVSVGDEGGYAPQLKQNEEAFNLILEAIKLAGWRAGKDVSLAIDAAASEFFTPASVSSAKQESTAGIYELKLDKRNLSLREMIDLYKDWLGRFPIIFIEDGLAEDDWEGWELLTKEMGKKTTLVGDDLFVTNPKRLKEGIRRNVANAILIKLNQIGTLSETIDCVNLAKKNNYKTIISHRSGETDDTFIADLAVAVNADFIKTGSLSRMERIAKYNRLMEIEEEL